MGLIPIDRFKTSKAAIKAAIYVEEIAKANFTIIGIVCMVLAFAAVIYFFYTLRYKKKVFLSASFVLVFGLQLLLDGTFQPVILNHKSIKDFSHQIENEIGDSEIYQFINDRMLRFYITI